MKNTQKHIMQLEDIELFAQELLELKSKVAVYTFTGTLGAGKTTLIATMLRLSGVRDVIASPTFSYVHMYTNAKAERFFHFDLYRLTSLDDFYQAGFDEYLYQPRSWSFIEWPAIIMPLLTHNVCHVNLQYAGSDRELSYTVIE